MQRFTNVVNSVKIWKFYPKFRNSLFYSQNCDKRKVGKEQQCWICNHISLIVHVQNLNAISLTVSKKIDAIAVLQHKQVRNEAIPRPILNKHVTYHTRPSVLYNMGNGTIGKVE